MTQRQSELLLGTLRAALAQGAAYTGDTEAHKALFGASKTLSKPSVPHDLPFQVPALKIGDESCSVFRVRPNDTASAMGHPDPAMKVLGSPAIALWFEIAASRLLPEPRPGLTHVGVGILVHHLAKAELGSDVVIDARVEDLEGKRVVFSLRGTVRDRLIALGIHERVMLTRDVG